MTLAARQGMTPAKPNSMAGLGTFVKSDMTDFYNINIATVRKERVRSCIHHEKH
jgi:hypothetical protein